MHIALGYYWFGHSVGFHIERALIQLGHTVTYVGAPGERAGYDSGQIPLPAILAQLDSKPDLYVWVDPGGRYFPLGIENLTMPTVCYLVDVHLGHWRATAARFFDAVFVAQKDYVSRFQAELGHQQVWWLPLAAAPDVHFDHHLVRSYDVGFVGSVTHAHKASNSRMRRLALIQSRFRTNDVFAPTHPKEVGRIYSQSKLVLNTSLAGDITMRVFEGAASGALMLTDSRDNGLADLFDVGRELIVFRDDEDMLAQIQHYLQNDAARTEIAQAGHARVHAQHTYAHRMQTVMQALQATTFKRCAPLRTATPNERAVALRKVWLHLHMLDATLDDLRRTRTAIPIKLWRTLALYARRVLR